MMTQRCEPVPGAGPVIRRQRTIHVVRHGETEFNRLGRLQGSSDPPLNAAGKAQARRAGQYLAARGVGRVISSPLLRANETADEIGRAAGVAPSRDPRLSERAFGHLEGVCVQHLRLTRTTLMQRLTEDPEYVPRGGESRNTVAARIRPFIAALLGSGDDGGETVVVVHGGWCDIATTMFLGMKRRSAQIQNGEVHTLIIAELVALDEGTTMWTADRLK